jgi:cytochrome c-type biogenesis protein CcmE
MNRQLRFAVGIGVILIAIAYFAFAGYNEGKAYYRTIDELQAMGSGANGKRLRVAGFVQDGSIVRDGTHVTFTLEQTAEDATHTMRVHYIGTQPVPDTFKDHAEAVVEGTCGADGAFQADQIQAKCASKYEAKYGTDAPKTGSATGQGATSSAASSATESY